MSKTEPSYASVYRWAGRSAWQLAYHACATSRRTYLWGPPGVGKSHVAREYDRPAVQVTLSEDFSVQELMGVFMPEGNVFRWRHGPVIQAMLDGALLVINEIGRASDAVRDFLLGVLDDPEVISIVLPSGETVKPAAGFAVLATSNSPPESLDPALRSRFEAEVHVAEPNPAIVDRLNAEFAGLGDALRNSFQDPARAVDPRKLLAFAQQVKGGAEPRHAAALVFGLRAPDIMAALTAAGVRF